MQNVTFFLSWPRAPQQDQRDVHGFHKGESMWSTGQARGSPLRIGDLIDTFSESSLASMAQKTAIISEICGKSTFL